MVIRRSGPAAVSLDLLAVLVSLLLGALTCLGPRSALLPLGGIVPVILAAAALALFWRRRAPEAIAWITAVVAAALPVVEMIAPGTLVRSTGGTEAIIVWPPSGVFAVYTVLAAGSAGGAWASWRAAIPAAVIGVSATSMLGILPDLPPDRLGQPMESPGAAAFRGLMFVAGAALLGLYAGTRRKLLRGLVERAERAEREQLLEAQRARVEERTRLAAEMHDVVTHRVTLMVMQAGALRVTSADESVRAAAEELRVTGCQALEELRDAVGLLRKGEEESLERAEEGGPAVPDLERLVNDSRQVGISVELKEEGSPGLASPVVGRTAYRVVQEALTNVRKHAPGAEVAVRLHYRGDGVSLTIRNSAATGAVDRRMTAAGSGTGLQGLGQRVDLVDGKLKAGPDGDGGFLVEAWLPAYVPTSAEPGDDK